MDIRCVLCKFSINSNSFLKDKLLHWCKLKALANDKMNMTEKLKFGGEW